MMLSAKHKFIFIHVYKVAGSSINSALEPYSDKFSLVGYTRKFLELIIRDKDLYSKINYKFKRYPGHIKAIEIKNELPKEIFDSLYKFAFVRNPWDWQVSLYHYMLQKEDHYQHKIVKAMSSFDEYIEWRVYKDKKLQKEFVTDDDGIMLVDFIGKYENLYNDFLYVCNTLGIECRLPHKNKSRHDDYKSYYNPTTKKLIEEHFKEDIDLFGYEY